MARIFISYKRVDKDKVFHLKDRIEAITGEKCWIDLDGIESDAQFKNIIIKAISMSEIVLFMYSKAHSQIQDFERDWTVRELNFAAFKKKRIVFVNLDRSALTDDFAFDFAAKQQVDATDDNAVKRLLSDLCRWLGTIELTTQPATMYDKNNKSISEDILTFAVNGVSFDMIKVEGGTFVMGATREQGNDAENDEKPTHKVTLSDYYIGKYVVTQELWEAVMGNNPSYYKGSTKPVESVSWDDCKNFINKLNILLSSQLGGKRFALPTEAQWEYAARGGIKSQGCKYAGSNNINDVAWYNDNSNITTHEVGLKSPNELGLYDMSGNVWEWCQDWYGDYSSSSEINPTGSFGGSYRVDRGGSWASYAGCCRVSYRCYSPSGRNFSLGFRLVLLP